MSDIEYYFDEMCRLCIKKEMPLFNIYEEDSDGVPLLDKIKEVCNIRVSHEDCLPKSICSPCRNKLKYSYEFRNMCLSVDKIFNSFITLDPSVIMNTENNGEYLYYLEVEDYDEEPKKNDDWNAIDIEPFISVDAEQINFLNNVPENLVKTNVNHETLDVAIKGEDNCQSHDENDVTNLENKHITSTIEDHTINDRLNSNANVENHNETKNRSSKNIDSDDDDTKFEKENVTDSINEKIDVKLSSKKVQSRYVTRRKNRKKIDPDNFDPSKSHRCKVCKKLFSSELRVKLHMQRLHKQVYLAECKVVCPKCGMKFQHVRNLRRHLVYHNSDSYFACSFCEVRLYSKKSWRKHLKVHDGETNVICKVCNKHVVSKVAYIYHMDYHRNKRVNSDQLFYSCRTCKIEFKLYEELEVHSLQNHCLNIPGEHDYLQGLHSKTLNHNHEYESSKINSHKLDGVHLVERSEVTASVREQAVQSVVPNQAVLHKNNETLKHEYTLQNINASVTFMCNICCRVYNNLIDLKYHVTECVKKLNQPKSFMCDICGKCFKSAWTLSTHKNGHSSDKPYICDTCGQGFKWLNDLSNHKRRIHEKLRPYVCKICGKTCGTSATLKSHVRYHTGERPYKCAVCKAAFTQNSSLKEHMYKHTGGEEGSCPICAKVFKTPLRLRTHIKRHNTQRKLYPCDLCGRMFTEKSSVRKHKNKIHTDMYQQHV